MTAVLGRLRPADRERLVARVLELRELDHLLREPGRQLPPPTPAALRGLAERDGSDDGEEVT
jgi:hypothetical protein